MTKMLSSVPPLRIRNLNQGAVREDGDFVLYWMTAYRRTKSNFALQRAADWARELGRPLVILSALRLDYRWATARSHGFMLDAMTDVHTSLVNTAAVPFSYVEPVTGAGSGLLPALAVRAAVVVADDAPVFFLPEMTRAAADRIEVLTEGVDHNSLTPLAATDRVFTRAYDLRRYLQRELPKHLDEVPDDDPLLDLPNASDRLIADIAGRWPSATPDRKAVADLAVDHTVSMTNLPGGERAARELLARFVGGGLGRYEERNHPDDDAASGLSPYLHFGNLSIHEVFAAVAEKEQWHPGRLSEDSSGRRAGWWGMSAASEAFLDQVITWRELGYRSARSVPNNDSWSALPGWARATLMAHAEDEREYVYSRDALDAAQTHDELWNQAQRQLRREGTIHNYLRMLWGKKILEWTPTPEGAHDLMFELNNRYALDGRDPNSVSGIHWVLGRYDRPWGPERPVFGKVRYMSSQSARRRLRVTEYLGQSKLLDT